MSSHPSPISTLKLRVTQGLNVFEDPISSSTPGPNNLQITSQTFPVTFNAFNNHPPGTIFTPSIVATYATGSFATGDVISIPGVLNFVPRPIATNLSLSQTSLTRNTLDADFSILSLISSNNMTGVFSFSSSHPAIASVNSSGLVNLLTGGTTTITIGQGVSSDNVYAAATPVYLTLQVDKVVPVITVEDIPDKTTSDAPFQLVFSSTSSGTFSFSSSNPNVLTVNEIGLFTISGPSWSTILINQEASADGVYAAATVTIELFVSAPPPSPTSMLVANYPFDSDGNDVSTNDNHLTNHNTVTFNTIKYKQGSGAASFNGSNYFQIANNGRFSPDNFTVAFWIKPVSSNGFNQAIASCRNMSNNVVTGWLIYIDPASNLTFITGGGGSGFYGTGNIYTNFGGTVTTWVHVAITMTKSTRAVLLYINGNLYTTSVVAAYSNNTGSNLRIGAGANEQQNAEFFLRNGTLLDDFRIYDSALSASQVRAVMANL